MTPEQHLKHLNRLGTAWKKIRTKERELAEEIHEAVRSAVDAGVPQTQVAKAIQADRMTVRRALGLR